MKTPKTLAPRVGPCLQAILLVPVSFFILRRDTKHVQGKAAHDYGEEDAASDQIALAGAQPQINHEHTERNGKPGTRDVNKISGAHLWA